MALSAETATSRFSDASLYCCRSAFTAPSATVYHWFCG